MIAIWKFPSLKISIKYQIPLAFSKKQAIQQSFPNAVPGIDRLGTKIGILAEMLVLEMEELP